MVNRPGDVLLLACAIAFGSASAAQTQQTLNVSFGYFVPTGENARVDRDLLNSDGSEIAQDCKLRMIPVAFSMRVLPAPPTR